MFFITFLSPCLVSWNLHLNVVPVSCLINNKKVNRCNSGEIGDEEISI